MVAWRFALALLAFTSSASGQNKAGEIARKTIRGEVKTGTLDSAIGEYIFVTRSGEAVKMFQKCRMNDECRVEADVKGDEIVKVRSVRLIKRAD